MDTVVENKADMFDTVEPEYTTVLFVCSGNTCRSPMAEAILNRYSHGAYYAMSAGTGATDGAPISANAAAVLIENGMQYQANTHRARRVTAGIIDRADKIVGISEKHVLRLKLMFPWAEDKIIGMPNDIPDPYMMDIDTYRHCFDLIKAGIAELFNISTDE